MGKVTGFLEFERLKEASEAPTSRVKHWKEFVLRLEDDAAKQQGARCMDCGIPFCSSACPVNNIIPDWNDLVFRQNWKQAIDVLHATNNFPEFTGRVCPAPCEAACTLNINNDAVGIKSIEHAIIDKAWENGWVVPRPPKLKTGKKVAVVGSGPAGLACAQQLARAGHDVTLFEKNDRIGGLMRYGIPDFKLEKWLIDRRMAQMEQEGVTFAPSTFIGTAEDAAAYEGGKSGTKVTCKTPDELNAEFDAVVISGGAESPRDLPIEGRELNGVHFAMDFLRQQNKSNAGDKIKGQLSAAGKHVVVIGGGDTGSDCVGTSNRHGAKSVVQFEVMPQPPESENKELTWPYWPTRMRTSSSHEEGAERDWSITTRRFVGKDGKITSLVGNKVEWVKDDTGQMKMVDVAGSEFEIPADLVLFAMGFVSPVQKMLEAFGVDRDARGNARANADDYRTNVEKVFAAGDMRRGQSLIVWAIREGRQCAASVDTFLMGATELPR